MADATQWEYRVLSLGSFWSIPKDDKIEALLDELGEEGWEAVNAFTHSSSNQVKVILKRPLSEDTRRRRSWPR
jgi:hypothetical protein